MAETNDDLQGEGLVDALGARSGIVCAVGAGGKKTTLYALARAHPGRVGFTATVFTTAFPRRLGARELVTDAQDLAEHVREAAADARIVAWARPSGKSGRVAGIDPEDVPRCHAAGGFDVTLVKADGARMRGIKAPREDEPRLAQKTTTVLPIVSAGVVGAPLDERVAHRVEHVESVTALARGATITPETIGLLLASPRGACFATTEDMTIVPVINAVDDAEREAAAEAAARMALGATDRFDRVVLTAHRGRVDEAPPWFRVITREA